eukprot:3398875-Pyramimonas_sp.AAC.1
MRAAMGRSSAGHAKGQQQGGPRQPLAPRPPQPSQSEEAYGTRPPPFAAGLAETLSAFPLPQESDRSGCVHPALGSPEL